MSARPPVHFRGLRFARTSAEAFRDHSYGAAIERPAPTLSRRVLRITRDALGLCQELAEAVLGLVRECTPIALYAYHRRHCRMGRFRALCRTVSCWL